MKTLCNGDATALTIPQAMSDLTGSISAGQLPIARSSGLKYIRNWLRIFFNVFAGGWLLANSLRFGRHDLAGQAGGDCSLFGKQYMGNVPDRPRVSDCGYQRYADAYQQDSTSPGLYHPNPPGTLLIGHTNKLHFPDLKSKYYRVFGQLYGQCGDSNNG